MPDQSKPVPLNDAAVEAAAKAIALTSIREVGGKEKTGYHTRAAQAAILAADEARGIVKEYAPGEKTDYYRYASNWFPIKWSSDE